MFKRGIGHYVVLALCILGMVFQPIKIFADSFLFNDYDSFISALNSGTSYNFVNANNFAASSGVRLAGELAFSTIAFDLDESFNFRSALFNPIMIFDETEDMYPFVTINYLTHYIIVYVYFYDSPINVINGYIPNDSFLVSCGATYDTNNGSVSIRDGGSSFDAPSLQLFANLQNAFYMPYGAIGFDGVYYAIEGYTDEFVTPFIPVPDLPNYPNGNGNTYNPDANSGQVNWPNFVYMIASWFFYNGVMNTNIPGQSQTVNYPGTVGIGSALTYDFLCKVNMGNSTVSYQGNDYPNYLFQLSELMYMMDESTGHLADYIEELELEDVGSNLADIKSDLEAAFPAAEVAINDSVADTVLDNSSGSGLTASKIVGAKSDLDDSLSKFSVSLGSDAEFSGVGSALDGQDWSFWSQQTFDNCYMFTFDPFEAQLMDGEDVATHEDNLFKQLLGWD